MAERDKVIKSGQLTLPRIAFLALVGLVLWAIVFFGGVFLSIGYWVLTLSICALLLLIAIDYGVKMDKVEVTPQAGQAEPLAQGAAATTVELKTTMGGPRPRRRASRSAKRRR